MNPIRNTLLSDLATRGLIQQSSDLRELDFRLDQGPIALYCGFDPTAESLHVGNLIPLITLARFQRAGHKVLALVGGATGLIGDPSGKTAERTLQSDEQVARRAERVQAQLAKFVDVTDRLRGELVNNLDWMQGVSMLEFLRDIGKHFSVNAMVARDSVKSRLIREGEGISFTEFSYMLLQAFDFYELFRRHHCELQIGGSDQWGNMCSGVDLIRRETGQAAMALTVPLLTTHDGKKFGKSESGAVWLDPSMTSVWEFYQFWLNTDDQDVIRLLKMFTFIPLEHIRTLEHATLTRPQDRSAQRELAVAMTQLVHGSAAAAQAQLTADVLFGGKDPSSLNEPALEGLAQALRVVKIERSLVLPRLATLLVQAGLEPSMTRANQSLSAGAVTVNGVKQTDVAVVLEDLQAFFGKYFLIRKGRKSFALAVLCN